MFLSTFSAIFLSRSELKSSSFRCGSDSTLPLTPWQFTWALSHSQISLKFSPGDTNDSVSKPLSHPLGTSAFSELKGAMQLWVSSHWKKCAFILWQCFTNSSCEWLLRHFTVVSFSPYAKPLHSGFGSQILLGTVWKHPPFPVTAPKGCESEIQGNKQPKATAVASPTPHKIFHNHLKTLHWRQLISISSKKLHLLNAGWAFIPPKGWELPKLY